MAAARSTAILAVNFTGETPVLRRFTGEMPVRRARHPRFAAQRVSRRLITKCPDCWHLNGYSSFTRPTLVTFLHIVTGWVPCRSKPTVTCRVRTVGKGLLGHVAKPRTVYERSFYRSVWLLEDVSRLLLVHVVAPVVRTCGVEPVQVQGWGRRTVQRQAPVALIVQTLVKVWSLRYGADAPAVQPKGSPVCGWLPAKRHPSYLDMLATLRRVLWASRINIHSTLRGRVREFFRTLQFTLCAAA